MLDKIIAYSFYLLFFLIPLFWTSKNYELFEYNKMLLTYGITVLIVGAWLLRMIRERTLILKRTPLDLPLLLFLGANILSTIFSTDTHTSIWGYYSRSNGGILSLISYLLLYFAFVSNMDLKRVLNTLKFALASGFLISLWAILEHFGISPSCVILRGEFNATCWIQDVQSRVFATLGQPNWLAGYLAMLIFPALYFYLTATTRTIHIVYYTLLIAMYSAFTFTYSRGPTLGLMAGFLAFISLYLLRFSPKGVKLDLINAKSILIVLAGFVAINLLFGSALTSFRLISQFAAPARPSISLPPGTITQLENGGTESGQIRFIVWQGALDIFKHYPVFGSGLETFAYSYYQFRPQTHNLTSEWDFLYNKAHNEYLNYLSTTGGVGFVAYMLVIGTFLIWSIKYMVYRKKASQSTYQILYIALFASYVSYLIYNFFLFSVVIIALFFYLFPALIFIATDSTQKIKLSKLQTSRYNLSAFIYKRSLYTQITKAIVIFITLYLLYSLIKIWYADTLFARGQNASEAGNPGRAYNLLSAASQLHKSEPFFRSELAYNAASAAVALKETDATLSAALKAESASEMERVLKESPNNTSFWRAAIRTYFELSLLDKSYTEKTVEALDRAISLAPTDPKLYYNKGLVLQSMGKNDEAITAFEQALQLKPNYIQAQNELEEATASANE